MLRTMLIAVLMLVSLATAARAGGPRVSFSFGPAYGHHHDHCHAWGPSFYYAPRPVYYYPAPLVQPVVPAYVAPSYSVAPPAAPAASTWTTRSEPRSNALPASQTVTSTVTIRNPSGSGAPVAFVVDENREVSLASGQTQTLANKSNYTVEFDRGGDFGTARKTLTTGAYEFVVTTSGWDLVDASRVATRPAVKRNELPELKMR